jgi:NAD-dependent DNA ligase
MKFTKRNDNNNITINGVRLGLTLRDSVVMRREADHTPRLQTFTLEDLEEDPEERTYWCAICKSKLVYLTNPETIWRCDNCLSYYDTKIQDRPIKNRLQTIFTPQSILPATFS